VTAWHTLTTAETVANLDSGVDGLTSDEARRRLAETGPNTTPAGAPRTVFAMFASQFRDFMIIVLLAAALISGLIGEAQDTIAILVIVLLNAVIGTVQEYRAEGAVAALRQMATPHARVFRDGSALSVAAADLVPGDVVSIEAGNAVPADLRMLRVSELQIDESALTGESVTVTKHDAVLQDRDSPIGDRQNLAFKGSLVTHGHGQGMVIATGLDTEIGRIAQLLTGTATVKTPLQTRLARFGRYLAVAVLVICAIVFTAGLLQGHAPILMFLTAVSLAVAAIPEALPAVVTISLAFGARKLIRHNALVRNLPAVETLGSVSYICTDKTGTLTENRMTAECFVAAGEQRNDFPTPGEASHWDEFGAALALNNDVEETDGGMFGEPTELALYLAARAAGFEKTELMRTMPRVAEIAFDSERKQMTTLHRRTDGAVAYVKGAPERVLEQCIDAREELATAEELASHGYRVLAYASRRFDEDAESVDIDTIERELSVLGLVALIDPPRTEVPQAVADCISASITPVMITGDHPGTARAIAARLGMLDTQQTVVTGRELAALSDAEFARRVETTRVYARVSPEQKLRIVEALQGHGGFVAMTGDGVNDAPALQRANIGVAMGRKGTDVAREAADMVLLDDDFATIVQAVRAGRRIFDNIRKFVKYTMSSNSGEIWTLFLAPFMGLPIPLLPIHILWINLVTDGLPGLAFSAEPAEPGIMKRGPRPPGESIFAHGMWQHILWVGLLVGGISILSQAWAIARGVEYWQTIVFTVLTVSQLFHSVAVRSERASLLSIGITSNLPMLGAVGLTVLMQLAVIYLPPLNPIFHTQPLPLVDLAACFALSSVVLVAVEIEKWLVRRRLIYQEE